MENKILVYLDKNKVSHAQSDYLKIANRLQRVIDFLRSHDMECDIMQASQIIENDSMVESLINEISSAQAQNLPEAVRKLIYADTNKVISELKKITMEARESITNGTFHKIDYNKLLLVNGKVSLSDEALKDIEDYGSTYIDTENRKEVYDNAQNALKAIIILQNSVDKAQKTGFTNGYKVKSVDTEKPFGWSTSILQIDDNGDITLNREVFQHII